MKNCPFALLACLFFSCGCDPTNNAPTTQEARNSLGDLENVAHPTVATQNTEEPGLVPPLSAEEVVRMFIKARVIGDQDALKLHCTDHPELDILFDSLFSGAAAERLAEKVSKVPMRELAAGDTVSLNGELLDVTNAMVSETRKLFVTNQEPAPFAVHLIDGNWKVDPTPSIEAKKKLDE